MSEIEQGVVPRPLRTEGVGGLSQYLAVDMCRLLKPWRESALARLDFGSKVRENS